MSKHDIEEVKVNLSNSALARVDREEAGRRAYMDMTNAARKAMAEEGFTRSELQKCMCEIAEDAVRKFLASHDMQAMMIKLVHAEVERQLSKFGPSLETVVRECIKTAAAEYAKQRVENAITVQIKDHW